LQLAQLSTGVTPSNISGHELSRSAWTGTQTVSISVAGLREDDTSYLFDGIEVKNAWYVPLAFFHLSTTFKSSRLSRRARLLHLEMAVHSSTSLVDRVQTNFTGPYLSSSHNAFDARNYFDQVLRQLHQNQFGASVGGPIRRNKMFFFGTMKDSVDPTYDCI